MSDLRDDAPQTASKNDDFSEISDGKEVDSRTLKRMLKRKFEKMNRDQRAKDEAFTAALARMAEQFQPATSSASLPPMLLEAARVAARAKGANMIPPIYDTNLIPSIIFPADIISSAVACYSALNMTPQPDIDLLKTELNRIIRFVSSYIMGVYCAQEIPDRKHDFIRAYYGIARMDALADAKDWVLPDVLTADNKAKAQAKEQASAAATAAKNRKQQGRGNSGNYGNYGNRPMMGNQQQQQREQQPNQGKPGFNNYNGKSFGNQQNR